MIDNINKCVIDTNVIVTANNKPTDKITQIYPELVIECISFLMNIKERKGVVVFDTDDEIFSEYKRYLSFSGQPGVGDIFFKWLHDNRWRFPKEDRVTLHTEGENYIEFPHDLSVDVDLSDRKFIAVANGHKDKPPIYEATDSKWWLWKEALCERGINIVFMSERYMRDYNTIT